jgi:hypothetical protein
MHVSWLAFGSLVVAAACGGDRHQIAIGPVPPRITQATLGGPLCAGDHCTCRDETAPGDGGAGVPSDGTKRFEIRLHSPQALWAVVRGHTLYKSPERAEACFYVDLPAGEAPVELRASDPDGVSAAWTIRELGAKTASWYDTFAFSCGGPGVCSFDDLDSVKREYAGIKRGLHDACGSTRIKGLTWDTGKAPDTLHPSELLVRLTLDVYKFQPPHAHGDPACDKGSAPAAGDPSPDGASTP